MFELAPLSLHGIELRLVISAELVVVRMIPVEPTGVTTRRRKSSTGRVEQHALDQFVVQCDQVACRKQFVKDTFKFGASQFGRKEALHGGPIRLAFVHRHD